ncbi:glutaminyl-peptide cyclotransferase [Amycolatopsis thermophila]|uniref:Glutamine cyclotransferase n=1 Tax=Amycolatopsis thermophila TaxID=206084 RepID=A0ABU0EUX3_9PSEU|nr:glutaminyl-peptide cyclotransferase [Amycolatopsis thermophila]MDQ0378939.1 glutamine cyclotransferase [Amycolatopsis thermophila]
MRTLIALTLAAAAALSGCAASTPPAPSTVPQLTVQVLETLPHDPSAFTQGLEFSGPTLYEGTGLVGRSSLRAGAPGQPPATRVDLPSPLFGEGITVTGPTVWQLTWQNGVAIERDARTLAELRRVSYDGEGWGLCHADGRLVMSDGSDRLTFRDPSTFEVTGQVTVHHGAQTFAQLNELECAGGAVYANVWQTDRILRIDPATGEVTGQITASGLLTAAQAASADVLNGIAAIPGTDEFLLTGKLWPLMFRVKFVPTA